VSRLLLVLTVTVDPTVAPSVSRADPNVRLADYQQSLRYWADQAERAGWHIALIENSGWPMSDLLKAVPSVTRRAAEIHEISYVESEEQTRRGKGVGEALMLARLRELLDAEPSYSMVAKVTGRLVVRRARRIFTAPTADVPWIRCRLKASLVMADSRLLLCSSGYWSKHLCDMAPDVREDEGVFLEHVLAKRILAAASDGDRWYGFDRPARIVGVSGSTGAVYRGRRLRPKELAAAFIARHAERLWL
jgi:hypothetical protein